MGPFSNLSENCLIGGYETLPWYTGPLYIGRKQIESSMVIGKVNYDWKMGYCKLRLKIFESEKK